MKILVTGFDPFGGEAINPAWETVKALPQTVAGAQIIPCQVPTVFGKSIETVCQAIDREQPDAVVCIGQAGGRYAVSVERVAINLSDGRIPDNAGYQPVDEPIAPQGPAAYFSTLPIKAMVQAIRQAGVPAEVSNTAGTYVCNHLMYGVLHHVAQRGLGIPAGFIHIPYLTGQVVDKKNTPSLGAAELAGAIQAALAVLAEGRPEVHRPEGALH